MKRYYSPQSHVPRGQCGNDPLTQRLTPSYHIKSTSNFNNPIPTETKKKVGRYYYYEREQIGRGYTSCVYKAYSIDSLNQSTSQQTYAIKVMPLSKTTPSSLELLENEIQILKMVDHPNVIKCYDIYKSKTHCYIITQFCPGGCLMSFLNKNHSLKDRIKNLNQTAVIDIVQQVIEGVKYLQRTGIVHRDIKPANILRGKNAWKIADFGFAILTTTEIKSNFNVGTPLYMPIQSLTQNLYSAQSDIFSVGIILYELLTGTTPWESKNEKQLIRKMQLIPLENTSGKSIISSQIFRLILRLCAMKKRNRMTKQEFMTLEISEAIRPQSRTSIQPSIKDLERQLKSIKSQIVLQKRLKPVRSMDQIEFFSKKENFIEQTKIPKTPRISYNNIESPTTELYKAPSLLFLNQQKQKYPVQSQRLISYGSKKDIYSSIKDKYFDIPSNLRPSLCLKNNKPMEAPRYLQSGSLRLDAKFPEKRQDNTRCTEGKQSQISVNPQVQVVRHSSSQAEYIQQTSHILLNQIHFCRFLFYIYKNSLYVLLGKKSQEKLAVFIFQMIFSTLDDLNDLELSVRLKRSSIPQSFMNKQFRTYLKSDKYALMKKTIKEYREKYEKEFNLLKIRMGGNVFQQIQAQQKKQEFDVMKSFGSSMQQSQIRMRCILTQLKSFLKEFDHNLVLTINSIMSSSIKSISSPRYNKNGFLAANVEGLKSLYQFYRLMGLLIESEKEMQKFERNAKIKVVTDYSRNSIYSSDQFERICGLIRSL